MRYRIRLLLLRWRLRSYKPQRPGPAVDYLIRVRYDLDDPLGRSDRYKEEARKVFDLVANATGESRAVVANRIQKGIARQLDIPRP